MLWNMLATIAEAEELLTELMTEKSEVNSFTIARGVSLYCPATKGLKPTLLYSGNESFPEPESWYGVVLTTAVLRSRRPGFKSSRSHEAHCRTLGLSNIPTLHPLPNQLGAYGKATNQT